MIGGLYSAAAGMLSSTLMESDIANNIANAGTAGYKSVDPVLTTFAPLFLERLQGGVARPLGTVPSGSVVGGTALNLAAGPLTNSPSPLAAAINGPGFFAVRTPQGLRYTRAGDFMLDAQGTLVTPGGDPVLSSAGTPLVAPPGNRSTAHLVGAGAMVAGGATIGRVGVFQPGATGLSPAGDGLYALAAGSPLPAPVVGATLAVGWVEGSNVNLVSQLTSLLQVQQAYTSDQQAVMTADHTMTAAITQVGAVA